tara:strand:+ start:278 stop:1147 length:870 start_codon:yes stop_codon:yes gene_type:complete
MDYQGFYINLDTSLDRRKSLEKHLENIKLKKKFKRFSALRPESCDDLCGLKTPGEYGIWLSILSLLKEISTQNKDGFIHIIEDDFRFNEKTTKRLDEVLEIFGSTDQEILFLDYMINLPLLNLINLNIKYKKEFGEEKEIFYPARDYYYSCMSSFLIKKSSSEMLFKILNRVFINLKSYKKLIPVDMALKRLLRYGIFKGSILLPPLGAPDWDLDKNSTIQKFSSKIINDSQRVYLLIRCAASGIKSPEFCALEFGKIVEKNYDNLEIKNLEDLYNLLENNSEKIKHDW